MAMELICLGTGTSAGVPMIGCDCAVCRSTDPRDSRTRPSVLLRYHDGQRDQPRQLLIDTSPEMRLQMIRHRIAQLDGVLYTHAHADHIFGLDDLRRFNVAGQGPLDLYAEQTVIDYLHRTFWYIFEPTKNVNQSFVASLLTRPITPYEPLTLHGATWTPLRLFHGRLPVLGYRIDHQGASLAYCTDVSTIPPETYPHLQGLDLLVIDALRRRHHPTHLTVDQALDIITQVRPRQALLTHLAHDTAHAELQASLPDGVQVAYDGLHVKL